MLGLPYSGQWRKGAKSLIPNEEIICSMTYKNNVLGDKCSYSEKDYNSSHRGKWTIGIGFVISGGNGFPVRCGAIPGSKNDTLTMEDLLVALKAWDIKVFL
jgi:hypothetical protein